jgi:hypothetical protein
MLSVIYSVQFIPQMPAFEASRKQVNIYRHLLFIDLPALRSRLTRRLHVVAAT